MLAIGRCCLLNYEIMLVTHPAPCTLRMRLLRATARKHCKCRRDRNQHQYIQDASSGKASALALPPPAKLPLQPDTFALRRMPANMSEEQLQAQQRTRQQAQQQQQAQQERQRQQGEPQGQQPAQQGGPAESPDAGDAQQPEGETEAAYLMRRAREFNVATRERPGELQLWLDFAAFQDEALAG